MLPDNDINIIATKILVEAQQALKELDTFKTKVEFVRKITNMVAKQIGGDWNLAAVSVMKFAEAMGMTATEVGAALKIIATETDDYATKLAVLNAEQNKVAASGDKLSRKLLSQQKAMEEAQANKERLMAEKEALVAEKLQARELLARQKKIDKELAAEQKKLERLNALGEKEARKAEQNMERQARQAALPKNTIPAFVNANFGDINAYIAQSQNKIEAWKRVVVASAKQAGVSFEQAGMELKKMVSGTTVAPLNTALKQLGDDGRSSLQKILDSANILRIALGAIVSMLLFQGIQAVTQFAKESVKQFTELEDSLFRIGAAEKVLSEAGAEVSVSGLKKGITELREELKVFSDEELTKLVGQLAILTKDLHLSEDELLAYARAVAIKNKISVDNESLDQTAQKLVTPVLTDNSKGAASLGISLGDAAIEAKALEMNLLKAGEATKDLTDQEKKRVKVQIILDSAAGDAERWTEFLETNSAKLGENTAAWEELQVAAGGFFATIIPALTKTFGILTDAINLFKSFVVIFDTAKASVDHLVGAFINAKNPITAIKNLLEAFKDIPKIFNQIAEKEIPRLFAKIPGNAPDWFKNLFGRFLADAETATGAVEDLTNIDGGETDKTLQELDDKLRDIAIDAQQARDDLAVALAQKQEDLDVKFTQKTQDIDTEYQRKEEDAAVDLQRKISDIERDAERERQRVLDKAREDEQKAEEDHQLKLWELKMRYLMDLEDALHTRDARQIRRLQRQYEFDKELAEKKKNQEDGERQGSLEDDLKSVEEKKQERLQEAQVEYQQKLDDLVTAKARELEALNLWKEREKADLDLWYEREKGDIERHMGDKIKQLLAGYLAEGTLHEEQQDKIHKILEKYFGKNKQLVDDLVAYTTQGFGNIARLAETIFVQAGSLLAGLGAQVGSVASNPFVNSPLSYDQMVSNQGSGKGHAEGGTVLATKPTTALFGERGPELATFTPIGRTGRDMNKLFGEVGGGGDSRIFVDVNLSPGLEGEIVDAAMDAVGEVIGRVNRSKVN